MAAKKIRRAVVLTEMALDYLSRPPGLDAGRSLLLWHLVKELPAGGSYLSLTDLAQAIALSRVHVTNGMKRLLIDGLILRGPKQGLLYRYELNPAYFHLL